MNLLTCRLVLPVLLRTDHS